jgi:hypothetical protein
MTNLTSRRSLTPSHKRKLSVRFQTFDNHSVSLLSSTDQSDEEWESLQAQTRLFTLTNHELNSSVDDSSPIPLDVPSREVLETFISEKQRSASEMTTQALDLQARFVWDLSFAIKQMLVSENSSSPAQAETISRIGVQDIVAKLQEDPPYPQDWIDWIRHEFVSDSVA